MLLFKTTFTNDRGTSNPIPYSGEDLISGEGYTLKRSNVNAPVFFLHRGLFFDGSSFMTASEFWESASETDALYYNSIGMYTQIENLDTTHGDYKLFSH